MRRMAAHAHRMPGLPAEMGNVHGRQGIVRQHGQQPAGRQGAQGGLRPHHRDRAAMPGRVQDRDRRLIDPGLVDRALIDLDGARPDRCQWVTTTGTMPRTWVV